MLTRVPLRAVLFDWDGTLLDSYRADAHAYLQMFREVGIPWGLPDLARHYSPDWYRVYRAAGLPRERWAEADRIWRHFYKDERPALHRNVHRVLEHLATRYRLGLITSGSNVRVRGQLRAFGLERFFAVQVFGDTALRRKPHPAPIQIAIARLGFEPGACVYIGDSPEDVEMAHRAGVVAVGILGQSPVPERLRESRPEALIANLAWLPRLLG